MPPKQCGQLARELFSRKRGEYPHGHPQKLFIGVFGGVYRLSLFYYFYYLEKKIIFIHLFTFNNISSIIFLYKIQQKD
jgi:hypothetical protein